jgi:Holliday junction resolvasome RuvABC ATP-dependent DNA helicase subunit
MNDKMSDKDKSIDEGLQASVTKALTSPDIDDRIALLSAVSEEAQRKGKTIRDELYRQIGRLILLHRTNPCLAKYTGQDAIKSDLLKRVEVARQRSQSLPHLLLSGPREMGKATLAGAIAIEVGVDIRSHPAADIKAPGDLAALLTNLAERDFLLIQNVERLNESVLEVLIQAAGDFQIPIKVGREQVEILLDLKRFTLLGTTSRASQVDRRLRRWMVVYDFIPYTVGEIAQIIQLIAKRENLTVDSDAAVALAEHCTGCPGNAGVILKRVRDYLDPNTARDLTIDLAQEALRSFGYVGKPSTPLDLASKVQHMDALEFEEFVGEIFREMGYAVETTAKSGDHGIDLLIRKKDKLIAVQCKHWDAPVGEPVIREFLGSLAGTGANSGYLVTSSTFTSSAYSFAQDKTLKLIDLDALIELIAQSRAEVH